MPATLSGVAERSGGGYESGGAFLVRYGQWALAQLNVIWPKSSETRTGSGTFCMFSS